MSVQPIGRALGELAARAPDHPALTHEGRTVTRRELDRRTNRLARAYGQLGVMAGDLVTIALPNGIEFYEACLAAWKLGATPQPVSPRLPRREREAIVELAQPSLVVGDAASRGGTPGRAGRVHAGPGALRRLPAGPRGAPLKALTSGGSTGRPKLVVPARRRGRILRGHSAG